MSNRRNVIVYSQLKTPENPPPGYLPDYARTRNHAVARVISNLINGSLIDSSAPTTGAYIIPDRPLYKHESDKLGIAGPDDLYGGVVAMKLHHDKAILHTLVDSDAEGHAGYSSQFAQEVSNATLPGYTAFSPQDALRGYIHLRQEGFSIRCKDPSGEGGGDQYSVTSLDHLEQIFKSMSPEKIAREGVVLEPNIIDPATLSIGQISLGGKYFSYYGNQHSTLLDGESTYGGTTLTMFRGTLSDLSDRIKDPAIKTAVVQAQVVRGAYSHYDPIISRLNFDVVQGEDQSGVFHSGVVDQSLRIGGASPAEVIAIQELEADEMAESITTRVDIDWHPTSDLVDENDLVFFDHARRRDVVTVLGRSSIQHILPAIECA
jgi:hypothetical protein